MNKQGNHLNVVRKGLALTGMLAGMLLGAGSVLAQAADMPPPKSSTPLKPSREALSRNSVTLLVLPVSTWLTDMTARP